MSKFFESLNSSVGRKWLMAFTGLFLCLFVLVHMSGNLQLFKHDGGKAFNQYAIFMTTFPLIKAVSYVNYLLILVHALNGFYLVNKNRKARPVKYIGTKSEASSSWSSNNMGILGTILLVFIVIHMGHFWREFHFEPLEAKQYITKIGEMPTNGAPFDTVITIKAEDFKEPKHYTISQQDQSGRMATYEIVELKDLYGEVAEAFKSPLYVAFYVLAMIALSYHLAHGFQSAFQTFGIRSKTFAPIIKGIGNLLFAIIIPALFAAMPLYFLFIKH